MENYTKKFVPLESNPETFNNLMYDLGVSRSREFVEVWSLDEWRGDALAFILILPDDENPTYQRDRRGTHQSDNDAGPLWLKQTIDNACGLYAILHCVCNIPNIIGTVSIIEAYCFLTEVENDSKLDKLIRATDHVKHLEGDEDIERLYKEAAEAGGTKAPSAEDDVVHHFISLVRHSGGLYLLDGEMSGPICKRKLDQGTPLTAAAFDVIREYTDSHVDGSFSLLALVKRAG